MRVPNIGGMNMANTSLLQVRTSSEDKEKASEILEKLGTNLSAVVNMMIKQIILTESIPFEVKINYSAYSAAEAIKEYEWAGEIRKVDIAKGNMFCKEKIVRKRGEACADEYTGVSLHHRKYQAGNQGYAISCDDSCKFGFATPLL